MILQLSASPSKQRSKRWLQLSKLVSRRFSGFLLCRLPLLALWTIIVIFLLHKTLNSTDVEKIQTTIQDKLAAEGSKHEIEYPEFIKSTDSNTDTQDSTDFLQSDIKLEPNVITNQPLSKSQLVTKKSSSLDYSRRGKVFILIIQNEYSQTNHINPKKSSHAKNNKPEIIIPPHIIVLMNILDSHRIEYDIDNTRNGIPPSLLNDQNNFSDNKIHSVIVIDDFLRYTRLSRWVRDQLDRHCRSNQIGVVTYLTSSSIESAERFSPPTVKWDRTTRSVKNILLRQTQSSTSTTSNTETDSSLLDQFPIAYKVLEHSNSQCRKNVTTCLIDYQVNEMSPVLRILKRKPNFIIEGMLTENVNQLPWISMSSNHISYEPLSWAKLSDNRQKSENSDNLREHNEKSLLDNQILSMYDIGSFDGIKRVIFGGANHHWVNKILLLDAIEHLSSGRIFSPLERYIQIDIDDIFVGEKGIRLKANDVNHLIKTQHNFAKVIEGGFKFNLGFSGKYFKHGFPEEIKGDEELIAKANEFTWFCHTWAHMKPHLFNDTEAMANELRKNLKFAQENKIPIIGYSNYTMESKATGKVMPATYAIAPHHSGVYPIHEQLYDSWLQVLNVQVTSTEEYPSLKPANGRRAFVHKTIKVMPRQTCGLYTHTIYRDKYPGGIEKLEASIRGGELFETVLHNFVNIYMTHMSNYANDRLAPYTFQALLEFVSNNTNLILKYAPTTRSTDEPSKFVLGPAKLAEYYFTLYPNELDPLWTNPCKDKRHLSIWSQEKHSFCRVVPQLLIVGPQKTGTTALQTYLKLHPAFKTSEMSPTEFEEIQFFNDKHYSKGVDWYFNKFSLGQSDEAPTTAENHRHVREATNSLNDGQSEYQEVENGNDIIHFDKSATYFDDPKVPQRVHSLLPDARIIILLLNPADRAYSWYQHMKAHGDKIANSMTFDQVIMSRDDSLDKNPNSTGVAIRNLRNRCLKPGYYSQHLLRWLNYFPSKHIIIIDAESLRHNPVSVMKKLQQLILRTNEPMDYEKLLVYNERKQFFCQKLPTNDSKIERIKCLGRSKGRKYPPMSQQARQFLNRHYWPHNRQLVRILSDIGLALPTWLDELVSIPHSRTIH